MMSEERPLVSVIIPTYNCADTIERCLRSVRAQTYPNIEIIVVDRGSEDGTAEIAAEYARVLQAGPERSAQVNYGARHARGTYLYRIDGDFELDPGVVAACVEAMEAEGLDGIAVPNRSRGDSYWAQVRELERDTYLGDSLIVAARFWRRSVFEAVGGFDESLVACEDYDLHNRLLSQGYKLGRVEPGETHLGEADRLWDYAVQSFYYGPSVGRYLRKHPRRGARQMFPLRPAYLRHWQQLIRRPRLLLGLILLKVVQYVAAAAGWVGTGLGLVNSRGRPVPKGIAGLALVLIGMVGFVGTLARSGLRIGWIGGVLVCGSGLALWQIVARRRAHRRGVDLSDVLLDVALPFSPLLIMVVVGPPGEGGVSREVWPFLLGLILAGGVGWLAYLAEPRWREGAEGVGPPVLVVVAAVVFVLVFTFHALILLRTFALGAYDLAAYDQALWSTAHGQSGLSLSKLLYTSISDHSLFADEAAPALLLLLLPYSVNIGGPGLLLIGQIVAVGVAAVALYYLATDEVGRAPAALIGVAYLVHFLTLRIGAGSFRVVNFLVPLLLFAMLAYRRSRYAVYYVLIILALACGVDGGMAVAGIGLSLILRREERLQGAVTLGLGIVWTLAAVTVWDPFFGGTAGQMMAPYAPPEGVSLLSHVARSLFRPEGVGYVVALLASLGLLPLLGAPLLLPALPRLVLNLVAGNPRYVSLNGWYEPTILPFLFVAAIGGLRWLGSVTAERHRKTLHWAGSLLILINSLTLTLFLAPNVVQDFQTQRVKEHHRIGHQILDQIPDQASVAAQNPFAVPLAHRPQLTILPEVADADLVLFDVFHPNREPQPELYTEVLQRVFYSLDYGLRTTQNGYLLFERGLDPGQNLERLALADASQIQYVHTVELSVTTRYLGFDLSTTHVQPGETFYVTHYWESVAPLERPYLLFTAYPGARRFEPLVWGLYPVQDWQPGDVVRHEQALILPPLPDGDGYEIVVGLWYGEGEQALTSPEQLLGEDVIRIATISVTGDEYVLRPWASSTGGEGR